MPENFEIESGFIAEQNASRADVLAEDYEHLGRKLNRRGIDIDAIVEKSRTLRVAIPSWGVGTGGTRFARFPGPGEPRTTRVRTTLARKRIHEQRRPLLIE